MNWLGQTWHTVSGGKRLLNLERCEAREFALDYLRLQAANGYILEYLEGTDYPWEQVQLKDQCSSIILSSKHPRTKDYLKQERLWPLLSTVLVCDHVVTLDAHEENREICANVARCLQP